YNNFNLESIKNKFSEELTVEGFTDSILNCKEYIEFIIQQKRATKIDLVRYPNIKVSFRHFLFHLSGTFEGYSSGIIAYEGTIEIKIIKQDEQFKLVYIKFYPRMMFKI